MVAADLRVAERRALLAPTEHRHDRGVHIDRHRRGQVHRASTGLPEPDQQLPRHRIELAHVVPAEVAQPGPDRRRRPRHVEQHGQRTGAQQRGVIDAVPASHHRPDHRQRLRAAVRAMPGQPNPALDQPGQVDPLRQHRGWQQPSRGHQIRLVEADRHPTEIVRCSHLTGVLPGGSIGSFSKSNRPSQKDIRALRRAQAIKLIGGSGLTDTPGALRHRSKIRWHRCVSRSARDEAAQAHGRRRVHVPDAPGAAADEHEPRLRQPRQLLRAEG